MMTEREPDWDTIAEQEIESRRDAQFGGHDFRYESSTDLFRCAICRAYEVTQREEDGIGIKPCPGPVSGDPMTLNVF
jgi:hypothetical protein